MFHRGKQGRVLSVRLFGCNKGYFMKLLTCVVKHFITICKHKAVVFSECRACGITWHGIIHDMSKFSPTEFIPSAKYFQGTRSPIDAEKDELGYSAAWLHHKCHNKHHWEYWTDFDDEGNIIPAKIPTKYVIEMICDWIGAGKVYATGKWDQSDPLTYYQKVRKGRHFHPETERLILRLLNMINDIGLDAFHESCAYKMSVSKHGRPVKNI